MPCAPGDRAAEGQAINITNDPYGDFNPSFPADGSRIAVSSNRAIFRRWNPLRLIPNEAAVTDLYVVDGAGSNLSRVVNTLAISGSPAWTADGNALLYYRFAGDTDSGIYRTSLTNGDTVRLTPHTLPALTPTAGPAVKQRCWTEYDC